MNNNVGNFKVRRRKQIESSVEKSLSSEAKRERDQRGKERDQHIGTFGECCKTNKQSRLSNADKQFQRWGKRNLQFDTTV
jgi:hypothetical protein